MKPTYEELETELKQVKELLKKALDRIAKLEEQINTNSKNSSKPPSTDKKGNTEGKEKEPKKGHKGTARSLYPPERVNRHVQCTVENCPHCGSNSVRATGQSEILQQAEIPDVKATVTEYQLQKYRCKECGENCTANLPLGIPDSAFGPKLMGLVATLTGVFHLAKREAIELVKELYDVNIGTGSIPNIEERVSLALDPIYQRIHSFVMEGKFCKHFDETGWRDRGTNHFVWIATSEKAAFYRVDRNRSGEAFERLIGKIPKNFSAVTDRYAVYNKIGDHQYCLAHLIRDFKKYAEREGPDKEIGTAIASQLSKACHIHGEYRKEKITIKQRNQQLDHCKRKVKNFLLDGIANGSDQLYKLSETLLDNFHKLWRFSKESEMDPTNNLAERDLRKLVIWRKKSYGTRSERGKRFVERITSIAQTLKKQNVKILGFIQEAIRCFYAKANPPSIFEALKA